tara:strand:- start:8113 stop:9315 length:1203 start_codon:yes stop_codon:yes gene_type:complete
MKYKVLRIMHRINVGGPTFHAGYLTKDLNDDHFKTKLLVGNLDKDEKDGRYILQNLNVKPIYIKHMFRKINLFNDIRAFIEIKKIIKDYAPDIVHTHAAKAGSIGRLAAITSEVPLIIHTFHGHVFHSYFNQLITYMYILIERFLAVKTNKIIAISKLQKSELSEKFKIASKNKFEVIPLGFDLKKFNIDKKNKRQIFRNQYNIKSEEIAVGIVGRLAPVKNHKLFIESIPLIISNTNKKIRFFIIGDGDERDKLENLCKKLNIKFDNHLSEKFESVLCFTSWREDVDVVNSGLDLMALTSLNEGTPVSLIEAQASNLPIVTTDVGGVRDIIIENETALVCDKNSKENFSFLLLKLIENTYLREQLSNKGYNHVIKNFSREKLVINIRNLYLELLNKKYI